MFLYLDPGIFTTKRLNRELDLSFDSSDQTIVRRFVANLEGVATKREKNGIPHNDAKMEKLLRQGLNELRLQPEYYNLVAFVYKHGADCLDVYDEE